MNNEDYILEKNKTQSKKVRDTVLRLSKQYVQYVMNIFPSIKNDGKMKVRIALQEIHSFLSLSIITSTTIRGADRNNNQR